MMPATHYRRQLSMAVQTGLAVLLAMIGLSTEAPALSIPSHQDESRLIDAGQGSARSGQQPAEKRNGPPPSVPLAAVVPPPDYVIGPDDQLVIVFWREKDMSAEVLVRPDGMISLPLLNDIRAAGLTPPQLRERLEKAADQFVSDPGVTVVVKQINSRKVFITGLIGKPGAYALTGETTVMQLIATAGGLLEYAKGDKIVIMRTANGRPLSYRFNYDDVVKQKNVQQNIQLKPGDTVVVR